MNVKLQATMYMLGKLYIISLLDALLQILYQVIASSGPLIISIFTNMGHEIGCFTLTHLRMKSLPKIANRVTPAEAR